MGLSVGVIVDVCGGECGWVSVGLSVGVSVDVCGDECGVCRGVGCVGPWG